jgi:hypothetical protein
MKRPLLLMIALLALLWLSGCSSELYQPVSHEVDDIYYLPIADAEPAVSASRKQNLSKVYIEESKPSSGITNPDYQPNSDAASRPEYYQPSESRLAPENNPYRDEFSAYRQGYQDGFQDAYWQMNAWGAPFMGNPWYSPYGGWNSFYYGPAWGWGGSWGMPLVWGNSWRYSPWGYWGWYRNCWNCWYGNRIYVITPNYERSRTYYAPRQHLTPRGTTFQQQTPRSTINTPPVQQNQSRQGRTRYTTTPQEKPTYTPRYRNNNIQQDQMSPRYRSNPTPRSVPSYNPSYSPSRSGGGRSRPR